MFLTREEEKMLAGGVGRAARKAMQILVALGKIYDADRLIKVSSVQVSGVSYKNLGDAGLEFLNSMAVDGHARVRTTLNPAGMSLTDWKSQGIESEFAEKQLQVIDAYRRLGLDISCTCTPYLAGNEPTFGQHIAWGESSAVAYANSAIGARTNREGGPSALAASLTGRTPRYGLHLKENRAPTLAVDVEAQLRSPEDFSVMGYYVGKVVKNGIPYFRGVSRAGLEELKILSAALASSGGVAMFHVAELTPESGMAPRGGIEAVNFTSRELKETSSLLNDRDGPDFVSVGCPHCSLKELSFLASMLAGRQVKKEFWICCSREVKRQADDAGHSNAIEGSGAKFALDTCMVVAPIEELGFRTVATNSAKACHYLRNAGLKVRFMPLEECVTEAMRGS